MDIPNFEGNTSQLPHNSAGPRVNVTDWALTGLAAVFVCFRIGCKIKGHRSLWWDDYVLVASFVFLMIGSILMSVMVHVGYGKHSWDVTLPDVQAVQPLALTRATFIVTAAVWSKTSFAITVYRLSSRKVKWLLIFIVVSMNLAMGLGCIFSWVTCHPTRKAWDPVVEGTCWSIETLNKYSIFSSSYSGTMDFVLAVLPWTLLWNVQMRTKEKVGVLLAMSMGILAGIVAFIKCAKINNLASGDLYDTAELLVWDSAEVSVTIVAASIPALRLLIREVNNSARQYYASSGARNTHQTGSQSGTSRRATFIKSAGSTDAHSDKSILNSPDAIYYHTEITVEHALRSD